MILMTETIKKPGTLVAEKLRSVVESLAFPNKEAQVKTHLTISVGVATFHRDTRTGEGMIIKAFSALERAKNEGGNRIVDAEKMLREGDMNR